MRIVAAALNAAPPHDAVRLIERRRFTLIYECTGEPAPIIERPPAPKIQRRQAPQPVPRDAWAVEIQQLAEQRIVGERGVGDTAKRLAGCDCEAKRSRWNALYPYASTAEPQPAASNPVQPTFASS